MQTTGTPNHVERYNRRTRWFHGAVSTVTLILLATGWWILSGHEGEPSALARLLDRPDTDLHRQAGWILIGLFAVGVTVGCRAALRFVLETARIDRGDGRWWWQWPRAAFTGRFARHRGHFDPGQRLANVGFVVTLGTLVVTGIALTSVKTGPEFVWLARVHRYATYALVALVAGHVLLAVGVLPGYRGAWRSMHFGGRTKRATAARLWPESVAATERRPAESPSRRACSERAAPPAR